MESDFLKKPDFMQSFQPLQLPDVSYGGLVDWDTEYNRMLGYDDYAVHKQQTSLWATWWLFNESQMNYVYERSGDYLDKWFKEKKVEVVRIDGNKYIFEARFEWRHYRQDFTFTDCLVKKQVQENVPFFVDYMSGLSWEAIEMLMAVRESSMGYSRFDVVSAGEDAASPELPPDFFEGYKEKTIYWNYLWLTPDDVDACIEDHAGTLKGTQEPEALHDWFRVNLQMTDKYPIPGEFIGMGVRIFPEYPWGQQRSNPFIFSGNFTDTAFQMRGQIVAIEEETDERPYKIYQVKTHLNKGAVISICATDFEDYAVDDRVTIIKDVSKAQSKKTFNHNDLINVKADEDIWMIMATTYYDMDSKK